MHRGAHQALLVESGLVLPRPGANLAIDLGAQLAGQCCHFLRVHQNLICNNSNNDSNNNISKP